jgi:hypothetical protein
MIEEVIRFLLLEDLIPTQIYYYGAVFLCCTIWLSCSIGGHLFFRRQWLINRYSIILRLAVRFLAISVIAFPYFWYWNETVLNIEYTWLYFYVIYLCYLYTILIDITIFLFDFVINKVSYSRLKLHLNNIITFWRDFPGKLWLWSKDFGKPENLSTIVIGVIAIYFGNQSSTTSNKLLEQQTKIQEESVVPKFWINSDYIKKSDEFKVSIFGVNETIRSIEVSLYLELHGIEFSRYSVRNIRYYIGDFFTKNYKKYQVNGYLYEATASSVRKRLNFLIKFMEKYSDKRIGNGMRFRVVSVIKLENFQGRVFYDCRYSSPSKFLEQGWENKKFTQDENCLARPLDIRTWGDLKASVDRESKNLKEKPAEEFDIELGAKFTCSENGYLPCKNLSDKPKAIYLTYSFDNNLKKKHDFGVVYGFCEESEKEFRNFKDCKSSFHDELRSDQFQALIVPIQLNKPVLKSSGYKVIKLPRTIIQAMNGKYSVRAWTKEVLDSDYFNNYAEELVGF